MRVRYNVPVELERNTSFFVPTLRPKGMFRAVRKHYQKYKYELVWEERIEEGVLGIRVWRVV